MNCPNCQEQLTYLEWKEEPRESQSGTIDAQGKIEECETLFCPRTTYSCPECGEWFQDLENDSDAKEFLNRRGDL